MIVDRSRFLKLALALAATTSVATTACSATTAADDGESTGSGAGAALSAGGSCTASSIKSPGAGSMSFYAFQEGFCFDLARHEAKPDENGTTARWFDFIYSQCRAYSQQLQPAVAKKVQACLATADAARPHDAQGNPTAEFDAGKMYDCGKEALWSICSDGIDGRVKARTQRVANMLKANGDGRALATIQNEVGAVLSGLKSSSRAAIETCVQTEHFDLYTCIEGISIGYDVADGEPAANASEACVAASAEAAPDATACDRVVSKVRAEAANGMWGSEEFARSRCEVYRTTFTPSAAAEALKCLTSTSQPTYDNIYSCGTLALQKICAASNPATDKAFCKDIVASISVVDAKADAALAITRECTTFAPGLKDAARTQLKSCVATRAHEIGSEYAFYSCVESLDPAQ